MDKIPRLYIENELGHFKPEVPGEDLNTSTECRRRGVRVEKLATNNAADQIIIIIMLQIK